VRHHVGLVELDERLCALHGDNIFVDDVAGRARFEGGGGRGSDRGRAFREWLLGEGDGVLCAEEVLDLLFERLYSSGFWSAFTERGERAIMNNRTSRAWPSCRAVELGGRHSACRVERIYAG
jgi:hypothetical protein